MAETTYITSPELRFLQGAPFDPETTDLAGRQMVVMNGPNAGQPTKTFVVTCGIAKTTRASFLFPSKPREAAAKAWPRFFPNGVTPTPPLFGCTNPQFAMKIQD